MYDAGALVLRLVLEEGHSWLLLWSNKTCTILGSRIGYGSGSDFRKMLDFRLIHGIVPMDIPENTLPNTLELNSLTYESI